MGASGKWLKSLITLKKTPSDDQEKIGENKGKKKWKLWRSASEGFGSTVKRSNATESEPSVASLVADEAFAAAMAAVARAQPKDFVIVKKEWAAIRIQAVFRGFLARSALRALRAVVRIQAIFRGRQVRKQAAVTLRCMQALVRVQARVRARSARVSPEGQAAQKLVDEQCYPLDPIKQAEQGWCDSPGTVTEVREKLHNRQRGAIKRERAIFYSQSQQRLRPNASPYARTSQTVKLVKHENLGNNSSELSWLDSWMASKPWENRLMEEITPEMTPFSKKSEHYSCSSGQDSVDVRRNNVTTRISARPLMENQLIKRTSSTPSSGSLNDETSASTSSSSASPSLMFSNSLKLEKEEETNMPKPSYMNLTASTKAKRRASRFSSPIVQRNCVEELPFHYRSMAFSNSDTRSCAGSNPSGNLSKDLYPLLSTSRFDGVRSRKQ